MSTWFLEQEWSPVEQLLCRCTSATESMRFCPVHKWDYPPRYMPALSTPRAGEGR